MSDLPATMKAVLLERQIDDPIASLESLKIVDKPVPKPGPGQVLVKIEAAPCNPSDLMYMRGLYRIDKKPPTVPGFEGCGTVVASGGGLMASFLKGKRVACGGQEDADGTWAEYFVANAGFCLPLPKTLSFEQGATMIANPVTAHVLLDMAMSGGHRAAIHTAGASQVGRMMIRLAAREGYPLINVVRRDELIPELEKLGAKVVLNMQSPDFEAQLQGHCNRLGASIVFEAVAGSLTQKVMKAMPAKARVVVYGALSVDTATPLDPRDLIFKQQTLEGFWLTPWFAAKGLLAKMSTVRAVQKRIEDGTFATQIRARLKLADVKRGLLDYQQHMSDGKVLICPSLT
ncbi:MAG TPA: zinc-binding dehydrogenase [Nevskiaceae bacterium]|nr:zinc-binding dehydrogenase [Nevskiaceae bacterium]